MTWTHLAAADTRLAEIVLFYALAALAVGGAVWVAASRNIVRTAVGLLAALLAVAGLYFLLHAEFLAAVQLVVYAGGTLILIIFGVMLTSKSPFSKFEPRLGEVMVALAIGGMLFVALVLAILNGVPAPTHEPGGLDDPTGYPVVSLGQALLGDYLVPFEIASVLLLVVMIGAAYLAKAVRPHERSPQVEAELSRRARQWS